MPLEQIHPMVVHFPIALALLTLAFDIWWFLRRKAAASPLIQLRTGTLVMTLGALAAVVTYLFGDMAYDIALSRGVDEAVLETHEGFGTAATFVFIAAASARLFIWWRGLDEKPAGVASAIGLSVIVSAMVVTTAYFGGHLVYGLGVNVASGA